jgi:hypothetical protein
MYYLKSPYISLTTQKLFLTKVHLELFLVVLEISSKLHKRLESISLFLEILMLSFSLRLATRFAVKMNKIDFFDTTNIEKSRKGFMFYCYYTIFHQSSRIKELELYYAGLFEAHQNTCENIRCSCKEFKIVEKQTKQSSLGATVKVDG